MEIVPTLRDLGIEPDPAIRAVGLDPRLFDDGANVIPFVALGRVDPTYLHLIKKEAL